VPRSRAPGRLADILDASLDVFCTLGYRRARMQDVAERAGVSPGLLYTYAAGKEALFLLVLQRESGVDVEALRLPVENPDPKQLEALIRKILRGSGSPALDVVEKATAPAADARTELRAIVADHYDRVHLGRNVVRLVERSALDWPELAEIFYGRTRGPFVQRLARYIDRQVASGDFRPVPDSGVAARYIVETIAWFAIHRYGDRDGARIDDALARETVVELLTNSFIAR
jgi:AcrR family transcriptional regulator